MQFAATSGLGSDYQRLRNPHAGPDPGFPDCLLDRLAPLDFCPGQIAGQRLPRKRGKLKLQKILRPCLAPWDCAGARFSYIFSRRAELHEVFSWLFLPTPDMSWEVVNAKRGSSFFPAWVHRKANAKIEISPSDGLATRLAFDPSPAQVRTGSPREGNEAPLKQRWCFFPSKPYEWRQTIFRIELQSRLS